jgi:hypothetical protein
MASLGFKALYSDTNHPSWKGAMPVAQAIVEAIAPNEPAR